MLVEDVREDKAAKLLISLWCHSEDAKKKSKKLKKKLKNFKTAHISLLTTVNK